MKISYYILFSFLFILLLFSLTTYNDYRVAKKVNENAEFFSRSTEIVRHSNRFQRNVFTMVSGLRGYLLTGERSFIQTYEEANKDNEDILQELLLLLSDSAQIRLIKEIDTLNNQWTKEYTEPLKQAKMLSAVSDSNLRVFNKMYKEKFATGDENRIQKRLQKKFSDFAALQYKTRDERKVVLLHTIDYIKNVSYIMTAAAITMALIVIIILIRIVSSRIRHMTDLATSIARGNYNVNIKDIGSDELTPLGLALNNMANELSANITLLKRRNEELDQFAHIVSHDMKAPLRGIGNVVTWIEEDHSAELPPKLIEYLELIKGRITRAENFIEGLLEYARADKQELLEDDIDMNELLKDITANVTAGNVEFEIAPLPRLRAERLLLFQICSNLIDNAIKYNDKEKAIIKIYCTENNTHYEFFVEDNGIGIAPQYEKKIFEIFQTLVDRDSFESTGVGLAIVKKILDSKQQTIKLTSVPGKGSVFSFTWSKK